MLPSPLEEIARTLDDYNKRLSHLERLENAGAWTLIECITIANDGDSFDLNNIPATFNHLFLITLIKAWRNATDAGFAIILNGDTGNNYFHAYTRTAGGGGTTQDASIAQANMELCRISARTALANFFSPTKTWFPNYKNTDTWKSVVSQSFLIDDVNLDSVNDMEHVEGGSGWKATTAISRITEDSPDGLAADSLICLYGIR